MIKLLQIVLFLCPFLMQAQTDTIAHLYTFGGANNDNGEEIKATSDGGYIIIGSTSTNSWGNSDAYLLKVDSNCTYQWSKALGGANNDWGYSIEETHDKGFIIAVSSNSYGNGGYDAVLMKRDSLGNYQWKKTYGGNDWDFAYDVVQTYDSGYVFCGETYNNTQGFSDVWVVKTNINGDTLWTKTVGGSLEDKGNAVIETTDSNIVVAGVRNTISDSTQVYVLKFSDVGVLLWDSTYGGAFFESANSIIEASNGDYVTTGASTGVFSNTDLDFYLMRLNLNGGVVWQNFLGNAGNEEAFDLYEDQTGSFFNIGYTDNSGGGMKDGTIFRVTSSGAWGSLGVTYGGGPDDETLRSVTIGNNGNICAAGTLNSYGYGLNDVFLVRLDTIIPDPDRVYTYYLDTVPLNINFNEKKNQVDVYPNPAQTILNISLLNEGGSYPKKLNFINALGQIIRQEKLYTKTSQIRLDNLKPGLYFLELEDYKDTSTQIKIIIK